MANMVNVLIQDDTDTTRTLLPVSNADQNLVWRANVDGVPVDGQIRLTETWEKMKDGGYRLSAKLEVPVMETIGAAAATGYVANAKVAYVLVGIFTMFAPARSSISDRANLVRMMAHLISGASDVADTLVNPATGAAAAFKSAALTSASVVPYSFVNIVMPS